jgi:hypothetical protein
MTIDSSWLHAFKEDHPHAFTKKNPFHPQATFVDGQIKLMQGFSREPLTWDQFIFKQFTRHLQKWFEVSDVVILAFDNYEHVPPAKCMTQAKRRRHIPEIPFSEQSELPNMVPEGDHWTQCIANRKFKTRVIDLVILRLPQLLLPSGEHHARKRLIIDYHEPRIYQYDPAEHRVQSALLAGMPALGEADVKFTRYADMYTKLMVDSIDGDSIPIALMHLERRMRSTTQQRIPDVAVYRMELHLVGTERTAGKKRASEDSAASGTSSSRERRTYEFVHINALYCGLKQAIAQSMGRVTIPTHHAHEMAMLVGLIALTGTDFTRNLPQMSGKTVYSLLPDVWGLMIAAYNPASGELNVDTATNLLVERLYQLKFPKRPQSSKKGANPSEEERDLTEGSGLEALLNRLRATKKLGERVKASLPSIARIRCTVRNANWLLAYWNSGDCGTPSPNPLQPMYGFRRLPNGATDFDDDEDGRMDA